MLQKLLPMMLFLVAACQPDARPSIATGPQFKIDHDRITVSGISSGAYMAGQMHIAHSATFKGAALLAGGPYWCAGNSLKQAIGPCVKGGDIDYAGIANYIERQYAAGKIDNPENLADDSVWIFHGARDAAVDASVAEAAISFYATLLAEDQIHYSDDIDVVHGMPTIDTGLPCKEFGEPYLNACDYDAAGELLAALYGDLQPRSAALGRLLETDQARFAEAELWNLGYLYIPASCDAGQSCGLHVAFHGCRQSAEFIGDAFARGAGFNEWAESNRLLVLYPQVASSTVAPLNPIGCWDWWGYTGDDYATREGAQVKAVRSMIDDLDSSTQ